MRRAAKNQAAGDDSGINFEDIPRLTEAQLASMVRLRDVPLVLDCLKSKKHGHLTRINDILANLMEAEQRREPGR